MRAYNDADLMDRLDEVRDPGQAKWWPYLGPLWIDLLPIARFEEPEDAKAGTLKVEQMPIRWAVDLDPDAGASQFLVGERIGLLSG